MKQTIVVLILAFLTSPSWGYITCDSMIPMQPGLSVGNPTGVPVNTQGRYTVADERLVFDNEGRTIRVVNGPSTEVCDGEQFQSVSIVATVDGIDIELARAEPECRQTYEYNLVGLDDTMSCGGGPNGDSCVRFDPINGRLYFTFTNWCYFSVPHYPECNENISYNFCVLEGLPTLFDIAQTYDGQQAMSFNVPTLPEGFPSADSFDTYYGDLATLGDFTQAQPLRCDYPAAIPQAGDYLTVPDSTHTPAPGSGYYFVTSVSYQGQRRYGRQSIGGVLSGRDPALLPGCSTP